MEHEAWCHTLVMLASAFVGFVIGGFGGLGDTAGRLITPSLMAMLVFVFVVVDPRDLRRSFFNVRFAASALATNFLWAPFLAAGMGAIFFGDSEDMRIGLLMLLAMPCTDWYLVFTASAKGNMSLSSSVLPMNLVLQVVLIPVFLIASVGASAEFDIAGMLVDSATILLIPAAIAAALRIAVGRSERTSGEMGRMKAVSGLLQLVLLCVAVAAMFASQREAVSGGLGALATLLVPFLIFFAATSVVSLALSKAADMGYAEGTSLLFTSLARNSPLALAIAASAFPDRPLVLLTLALAPLVELPVLSLVADIRRRRSPRSPPYWP